MKLIGYQLSIVLIKAFECFQVLFNAKCNFQGLFKTVLYIHVHFKPVGTLENER